MRSNCDQSVHSAQGQWIENSQWIYAVELWKSRRFRWKTCFIDHEISGKGTAEKEKWEKRRRDERESQRVREDRKLEKWRIRRQKKRRQKVGDEERQKTPKSQKSESRKSQRSVCHFDRDFGSNSEKHNLVNTWFHDGNSSESVILIKIEWRDSI